MKNTLIMSLLTAACFTSAAYADAPTTINVYSDMTAPFNVTATNWYQFNDATGVDRYHGRKEMIFTLKVDENSKYGVQLQCWRWNLTDLYNVMPGQVSPPCSTTDAVKIVNLSDQSVPASGVLNITVVK